MLLAIDIGNTNVTCAVYDKKWINTICIPANLDFWDLLNSLKEFEIKHAAISSVVPKLTSIYIESIRNLFKIESFIITNDNCKINLNVDEPKDVGTDRICNSVAAQELIGCPAVIGDIGSATNYDVIDYDGIFIGGAIAPGLETAAKNLFNKAALLNATTLIVPSSAIGKNTATNLQSGIMLGAIDVIDGMFLRIQKETQWKNPHYILTGGFGELISPYLKTKHDLMPNLTLDGIRIIFEKNNQ